MTRSAKLPKKQRLLIAALAAACLAAMAAALLLVRRAGSEPPAFVPPPFEEAAVTGVPSPAADLGWSELAVREGYRVRVCGVLRPDGAGNVPVWFFSAPENDVWLRLRLRREEDGELLGQTGVIRPGEYVELLHLDRPASGDVLLEIMGYEPETYYSAGTARLATTLDGPG